jgi:hypothetical protein
MYWEAARANRLDELESAHQLMRGSAVGRQWRTEALNVALMLRLAAEFQGFVRDLHDLSSDTLAGWSSPSQPAVQNVIRTSFRSNREIDRGNAKADALSRDFGRFGFKLWDELPKRTLRAADLKGSLERLNKARNGLAHADETKLAELRSEGYPIILDTFRKWRRHLQLLATHLDAELSAQLGTLFGVSDPW